MSLEPTNFTEIIFNIMSDLDRHFFKIKYIISLYICLNTLVKNVHNRRIKELNENLFKIFNYYLMKNLRLILISEIKTEMISNTFRIVDSDFEQLQILFRRDGKNPCHITRPKHQKFISIFRQKIPHLFTIQDLNELIELMNPSKELDITINKYINKINDENDIIQLKYIFNKIKKNPKKSIENIRKFNQIFLNQEPIIYKEDLILMKEMLGEENYDESSRENYDEMFNRIYHKYIRTNEYGEEICIYDKDSYEEFVYEDGDDDDDDDEDRDGVEYEYENSIPSDDEGEEEDEEYNFNKKYLKLKLKYLKLKQLKR
jgi:hypothetical protein